MSTEGFPAALRFAVLALGVAVLAPPAVAAQVDFRPVLTFGLYHSGNVKIIGDNPIGDDNAAIAVDLAVDRTTLSSEFSFLYQATYVGYRENRALNFLGNLLSATYENQLSRRTNLRATGYVSRTDAQGIAAASIDPEANSSNVDRPLTFVPRTTITRGYGSVSGSVGVGRRSLVDWEARAGVYRFDAVSGVPFNNSTSVDVLGGWRYELSERTTLGVAVTLNWCGYEGTANSFGESVVLAGTHALSHFTSMKFYVGATRTTTADFSSIDGRFLLSFERALTANSSLNTGIRRSVTSGTGLLAATNDTGAWVSCTQSSPRLGLYGGLQGAYWLRETLPTENTPTTEIQTLNLAGALGWRFNRFLSLSAAYAQFFQEQQTDSSSPLNTRYASYGIFLRWAMRGLEDVPDLGRRTPRGM